MGAGMIFLRAKKEPRNLPHAERSGRRKSKCKGPEEKNCSMNSRNREKANGVSFILGSALVAV
jgi:hypothetical protein